MTKLLLAVVVLGFVVVLGRGAVAGPEPTTRAATPIELGAVAWQRDLDAAVEEARKQGRALLVLFQEVPG